MPFLRVRHDITLDELAHLVTDGRKRFLEPTLADARIAPIADELDETRAATGIAIHEAFRRSGKTASRGLHGKPEIGGTHDLARAHGDAALHLREILTDPDLDQQFLDCP